MNEPEPHKGLINIRTAMLLYAVLAVWSVIALKGLAMAVALIVVVGLAVKSYVHFLRSRIE